MINIGENIKEELDRQERTISWLARKLNRTRTYVYRMLKKKQHRHKRLSANLPALGKRLLSRIVSRVF